MHILVSQAQGPFSRSETPEQAVEAALREKLESWQKATGGWGGMTVLAGIHTFQV